MKFKNGAVADITASRLTFEKQRKIRIFQEDAYISLDYGAQSCKIFRRTARRSFKRSSISKKPNPLKKN